MVISESHASHIGRVRVAFTISGANLDPDKISSALKIMPSFVSRKGDPRLNAKGQQIGTETKGSWMIESVPTVTSKDINEHFKCLLGQLVPMSSIFEELIQNNETFFDVPWESSYLHAGTGPLIDAENLRGVAALKAGMGFDIYQISENAG